MGAIKEVTSGTSPNADGFVEIAVRDTGIGLSETAAAQLFEAFYTTKPRGMGMGLSVARSIVSAHGGSIRAFANDEGGATVAFTLPITATD